MKQTKKLLDQYETYFRQKLAESSHGRATTFREMFARTIDAEMAKQELATIQENRRLMSHAN